MKKARILFQNILVNRIMLGVLVLLVVWGIIALVASATRWKIIFLDNGQVYFGKTIVLPFSNTVTLRYTHFLRQPKTEGADQAPTEIGTLEVVSLKGDPQTPEDKMFINRDHILYIEYVQKNSLLAKALTDKLKTE